MFLDKHHMHKNRAWTTDFYDYVLLEENTANINNFSTNKLALYPSWFIRSKQKGNPIRGTQPFSITLGLQKEARSDPIIMEAVFVSPTLCRYGGLIWSQYA